MPFQPKPGDRLRAGRSTLFTAQAVSDAQTVQGGLGSGSASANAVPQHTANAKAGSRLANCPRSPREVVSPSSSRMETRAIYVLPALDTDGWMATPW
jgi:hypothetical protein